MREASRRFEVGDDLYPKYKGPWFDKRQGKERCPREVGGGHS